MSRGERNVLAVNAGSSSIKVAVYTSGDTPRRILSALIDGIHAHGGDPASAKFSARRADGTAYPGRVFASAQFTHADAFAFLLDWLGHECGDNLVAAGHRVVHGGEIFARPTRLDASALAELDKLVPLAPLHEPHNIAAIRAIAALRPALPQVACFDTAFHRGQPRIAQLYGLPHAISDAGVRRYGFHGLSYEYISGVLPQYLSANARRRVVVAHLGNGASLCAMQDGASVATSMGFSTLDGVLMGTRGGSLDPGVLLYLMRQGYDLARLEAMLYRESGLLGVSGTSADMRDLLASSAPRAAEAVDLFVYRIAREIGSLTAALGGLDALVFTGGIGEHAAVVRERICGLSAWLGVDCDPAANAAGGPCITAAGSAASAWVIPTDEESMIVRHTLAAIAQA